MKHKNAEVLKAIADDPNVKLQRKTHRDSDWEDIIVNSDFGSSLISDAAPFTEFRLKPKEPVEVSMWQWIYKGSSGYRLTLGFYTTQEKAQDAYPCCNILCKLESSHILVEEE